MGKTLGTIAKIAVGVGLVVFAPQVTAALLVASGTTVAAAATVTAITSAIMGIGASLALSTASTALFGPKAPKTQLTRLNVSLDPITPRKAVFGTTAMPLDLRYHEASGTNQDFIDYIIAVAAHKVTAISEIWFEEKQAWTASGGVTATYNGFLTVTTRTEGTSANTIAINGGGKWGSSRRLTGCAYVHLRIKRTGATSKTQSPLVNGLPSRVTIIGNGALLYDPRKDSTVAGGSGTHRAADQTTWGAYTDADDCDNPALQLLWWLLGWKINGKLSIGCGVPANRIDIASFITAANICDENVTLAIGGTQKRYRTSGTASDSDNRMDIINTFLTSMNGTLRDNGGKLTLSLMKNDLASYSLDLSENDMLGEFEWQQTRGLTESYNVVRGRYVDPSVNSLYQPVDYPEVSIASADGIERATTLDLMYVEDGRRAQRIAKQVLQRNQYRGMFSATFNTKALGCQVGDVVRLTVSSLGWTNKLFRVVSQEIRFDGQVPLALVEENAAIYAWSNEDQAPVVPTSPTIYNPLNDPFILGLVDAQAIADGKIDSYYQAEPPTGATEGDYWTDTNDANKLYRYTSGVWTSIQDGGIPTAISAAAGAQATANGKVTTYYSETTPTATAIGDLWYKPSTGFVQRWNGSAWADVATLGATIGENVKDKSGNPVAIEAIRNNLALIDWWKKGATIPWSPNAEFNSIISVPADAVTVQPPTAGQADVWFCEEVTGNGEQGGGWTSGPIAFLNPDKAYRFVLPIRRVAGTGQAYWGINGVADANTTTLNTNPYFAATTLPNLDRWYLFVGYIFPRNSTGKNSDGAGIWDCKTGTKIQGGLNYCFLPDGTQPTHRAYQYYASLGAQQMFGMPLIEPIESMSDMTLYFEEAARLNNAIGINGSGQFVNPVGTGNNTVVANNQIAVDGSGQLAGIGTGNNTVVANNQINITSGNLNGIGTGSGTTVANNQIAVNVSGQISGIGTGNLTEVGNDRMDITFDTLGTDGRVRAQLRRNGGTTVNTTIQLPSAAQNADQLWNQVSGTGRPQDNATVGARAGTNIFRTDGTTVMTQAEIRTAEGTAAAILNQAATATNSDFSAVTGTTKPENNATVGATAGTNLRRSNATVLSDNDIITSLGTAALIANQGPGATAIASDVLNNRVENSVVRVRQPVGGTLQNQNSYVAGAIRIQLPVLENNGNDSMIRFLVDIYEYVDNKMQTYEIAGYNWHLTGNWLATSARMIGGSAAARPVRFGRSGGTWAIWIGDQGGGWSYPAVVVRDLQVSYSNVNVAVWDDGWVLTFDTSAATNVSKTVSNPNAGDAVFGVNALETWNGAVATLPNFKTIEGTAAAISGQAATATNSDFSAVTGATKPENNATVGARAGTNLRRSNNTVVGDTEVLNESQQWNQVNSRPPLLTGDYITADELLRDPSVWDGISANWFYVDTDGTGFIEAPSGSSANLYPKPANATPIDHSATYEAEWEILEAGSGSPTSSHYTVVSCWDAAGNLISQDGTFWYYPTSFQPNIGRGSYERRLARFGKGTARPFPANAVKFGVGILLNYNASAVVTRARRIRARRIEAENLGVNGDASRWQFANNTAIRWSGNPGWAQTIARSKSTVSGAQSLAFDLIQPSAMCGLTDAANPSSYTDFDYAWYAETGGAIQIYENGSNIWSTSGYTNPDDVRLRIDYDGNIVRYYINGSFARSVVAGSGRSFRVGVDCNNIGSGFRNIRHLPIESNAYVGVNTYNSTGGAWSAENGATIGATAGTNLRRSNATVLGDNDIITSLGTAANIAGQAATATSSDFSAVTGTTKPENNATVGATAGTNLRRANATVLNDGDIITSLGTAALIANQGALATRSNARLGNEVVDESGNAIAAEFIRNNVNRGNVGTMAYPSGGSFAAEVNGLTGAFQIMLPNTFADGRYTMIKFQVDIYNYSTDTSVTYDISGYVYPLLAAPTWYNMTAKVVGGGVGSVRPVRFGRTGSASTDKFCVWIGDTGSVWYYPKVQVRNVLTGYSSPNVEFWQSGWAISTVTAFGTIDASVLNPTAGDAVFGVNAREEWNGAVATLPNFKTIQGTAAAITSQGSLATKSSVATADISANAVTTGSSAFGDSSIDLTTSWQTMASCTVAMSGGAARVDFCALINGQADSTGCPVNIRLLRNGTSIRETNLTILPGEQTFYTGNFGEYAVVVKTPVTGSFPMFLVDTSGATGSVEFIVQLKLGNANADFASAAHRQIVATEFKR